MITAFAMIATSGTALFTTSIKSLQKNTTDADVSLYLSGGNPVLDEKVIAAVEAILKNGGIAEIKNEKAGIVVVDVSRKVKYRPDR